MHIFLPVQICPLVCFCLSLFFGCIHFLKYFFHSSNFSNVFESTACFFSPFPPLLLLLVVIFLSLVVSNLPRHEASSGVKASNWCQWLLCKLSEAGLEDLTCLVTSLTVIPSFLCRVIQRQLLCIQCYFLEARLEGKWCSCPVLHHSWSKHSFYCSTTFITLLLLSSYPVILTVHSSERESLSTLLFLVVVVYCAGSQFSLHYMLHVSSVRAFLSSCLPGRN